MNSFNGYKTYLVGSLGILGAIVGGMTGTVDPASAAFMGLNSLLGMTIRHGIASSTAQTVSAVSKGVAAAVSSVAVPVAQPSVADQIAQIQAEAAARVAALQQGQPST